MPRNLSRAALASALCCAALALSACKPTPPDPERPVEPQAHATGLRDAMQEPLDKAKAVEGDMQKAAEAQRAAIEAAGG
ncbi:hypothetical protein [Lysobacter sp. F60174L2]|uniref:hypothetical protein n=1 Tax=Lysobacter sp. F60174L2 TaxID=3459295 RepID=UPI00403DA2D4